MVFMTMYIGHIMLLSEGHGHLTLSVFAFSSVQLFSSEKEYLRRPLELGVQSGNERAESHSPAGRVCV